MSTNFRDRFKRIQYNDAPFYQAKHGKYRNGHYNVQDYWSAGIQGVPKYDSTSLTEASLKWRCNIVGACMHYTEWMCDSLDEAFDSIEKEVKLRRMVKKAKNT